MAGARALLAVAGIGAAMVIQMGRAAPDAALAAVPVPIAAPGTVHPTLPPVTEHPVDPAVSAAAARSGGSSVVQTIRVTVIGGELTLQTRAADVALHRDGDRLVGALPPIRVVDARGTHRGWKVRFRVTGIEMEPHVPGAALFVTPSGAVAVGGLKDGLRAGPRQGRHRSGTLLSAAPGTGGGTYEGGGIVELRLPAAADVDVDHAVVGFTFDLR